MCSSDMNFPVVSLRIRSFMVQILWFNIFPALNVLRSKAFFLLSSTVSSNNCLWFRSMLFLLLLLPLIIHCFSFSPLSSSFFTFFFTSFILFFMSVPCSSLSPFHCDKCRTPLFSFVCLFSSFLTFLSHLLQLQCLFPTPFSFLKSIFC